MPRSHDGNREDRILDSAAELIAHYGYDKTTVEDIARHAGVSKGAIYLHFSSKDQLFESLLIREMKNYSEYWLELIDADPKGGLMSAMYKNMLYALERSPFMAAMFTQDRRIFGNYLRKPDNFFRQGGYQSTRYEFVEMMQDAGAMRRDLNPKVVAHIMNIMAYGLIAMDEIVPQEQMPPTEEIIEGIGAIMDKALMPEDGGDTQVGKVILKKIADAARDEYEKTMQQTQE